MELIHNWKQCPRRSGYLKGGVVGEVSFGDDGLHGKPNPQFPTKIEIIFVELFKSISKQRIMEMMPTTTATITGTAATKDEIMVLVRAITISTGEDFQRYKMTKNAEGKIIIIEKVCNDAIVLFSLITSSENVATFDPTCAIQFKNIANKLAVNFYLKVIEFEKTVGKLDICETLKALVTPTINTLIRGEEFVCCATPDYDKLHRISSYMSATAVN